MKRFLCLLCWVSLALAPSQARADAYTFFEGTGYPLTVHWLRGEQPGPTAMVQGGIQGDEVSGFLTAQALTAARIKRGNLIVVPRANAPSIHIRQRQVNVDLNRRFDQDYNQFFEDRLARAIRFLVGQSDLFIHLHEGSGFYSPAWIDSLRNPRRYGQSVIIDASVYEERLQLAREVSNVLRNLNSRVEPSKYRFQLFNMDTFSARTAFPEQKKSLTHYVLQNRCIPAMAIEVSKNIPKLSWKVRHQLLATQAFLAHYGVDIVPPALADADIDAYPRLSSLAVTVNGQPLPRGDAPLALPPVEPLRVSFQAPGPFQGSPAVFATDREGVNLLTVPRLPLSIQELDFRLDGQSVRRVRTSCPPARLSPPAALPADGPVLLAWLNGRLEYVPAGQTLEAREGDQLVLEGLLDQGAVNAAEILNFKGWTSGPDSKDGQDVGQEIILDSSSFQSRYVSRPEPGVCLCRVTRETPGQPAAEFTVRVTPRRVEELRLTDAQGQTVRLPLTPDAKPDLPAGTYVLAGAVTNGGQDRLLVMVDDRPLRFGETFAVDRQRALTVYQAATFVPLAQTTLRPDSGLALREPDGGARPN